MTVLLDSQKSIHINDVTINHIVVAIIDGMPCILGKGFIEPMDKLSFFIISGNIQDSYCITSGNGFNYNNTNDSIKNMIECALEMPLNKVEVFEQKDWRLALQWLINNSKI